MSKQRWILFLIILLAVDLLQFLLTPLVAVATFIDIIVGFLLPLCMHLAGERMNFKKLLGNASVFGIELIPALNALPLWSLYLVALYLLSKGEERLAEKIPGISKVINKVSNIRQPLNKDGVRLPNKS